MLHGPKIIALRQERIPHAEMRYERRLYFQRSSPKRIGVTPDLHLPPGEDGEYDHYGSSDSRDPNALFHLPPQENRAQRQRPPQTRQIAVAIRGDLPAVLKNPDYRNQQDEIR